MASSRRPVGWAPSGGRNPWFKGANQFYVGSRSVQKWAIYLAQKKRIHQPGFFWNKGFLFLSYFFGVRSCDFAMVFCTAWRPHVNKNYGIQLAGRFLCWTRAFGLSSMEAIMNALRKFLHEEISLPLLKWKSVQFVYLKLAVGWQHLPILRPVCLLLVL